MSPRAILGTIELTIAPPLSLRSNERTAILCRYTRLPTTYTTPRKFCTSSCQEKKRLNNSWSMVYDRFCYIWQRTSNICTSIILNFSHRFWGALRVPRDCTKAIVYHSPHIWWNRHFWFSVLRLGWKILFLKPARKHQAWTRTECSVILVGVWMVAFDSIDAVGNVQATMRTYLTRNMSNRERKHVFNSTSVARQQKCPDHVYRFRARHVHTLTSVLEQVIVMYKVCLSF